MRNLVLPHVAPEVPVEGPQGGLHGGEGVQGDAGQGEIQPWLGFVHGRQLCKDEIVWTCRHFHHKVRPKFEVLRGMKEASELKFTYIFRILGPRRDI